MLLLLCLNLSGGSGGRRMTEHNLRGLGFFVIHMKDGHETKPSKLAVMCPGGVCENHTAPIKIWRPTP